jgi:hypothetical protein
MSKIRDKAIPYDTVRDSVEDGRDIYDDIERVIDGQTEEEANTAKRLADINRFLDDLPKGTADVLRGLLDSQEVIPIGEIAKRIGINRSTFFRNIRRASRRTWGTERPPFHRGGSECG